MEERKFPLPAGAAISIMHLRPMWKRVQAASG